MPAAYKLLWDFICHDCDHAGIWHVDFDVAQLYIGNDAPINNREAFKFFNEGEVRVETFDSGDKWFIRPFIEFQYGTLNPANRVHLSILNILKKNKIKPLISPLLGAKDKDKDKDKDKVKEKDKDIYEISFKEFWEIAPARNGKKIGKEEAKRKFMQLKVSDLANVIIATHNYSESEMAKQGTGIKDPHRFLSNRENKEYWKEWMEPEEITDDFTPTSGGGYDTSRRPL